MKTIQIDPDIYSYLISRAVDIGEAPSRILRRELHLPQLGDSIEIDDDVYAYLVSRTIVIGESASDILRRELRLPSNSDPDSGHGSPRARHGQFHPARRWQALNVWEHTVVATVGDTLRIFNDDTVPHRHTDGTRSHPLPTQSRVVRRLRSAVGLRAGRQPIRLRSRLRTESRSGSGGRRAECKERVPARH
jgi:predicted CopG family antitoxin